MTIIGHWKTLAEAQKLSLTQMVTGIFPEVIEMGGLLPRIPGVQVTGTSLTWNRELSLPSAKFVDVHEQLTWDAESDYTQMEIVLKLVAKQTPLDKFVESTYGSYNNYKAIQIQELRKGCTRTMEDKLIYGDTTYVASKEIDGWHAWAALNTGTDLDIDGGEGAHSLMNLRKMIDAMKMGCDILLMPYELGRRFDALAQEQGVASFVGPWRIAATAQDMGKPVLFYDGVPIVRSDFMKAEQANTGGGSSYTTARGKYASGTKQYSIFGIKWGSGSPENPGVCLAWGNGGGDRPRAAGEVFSYTEFDKLEDYDASGVRLTAYLNTLVGSSKCIGRVHDITDAAITA